MALSYSLMFLTGLAGGVGHCIGMCGPLVASYTLSRTGDRPAGKGFDAAQLLPHLGYNLGRLTTYTLLGAVMGLAGSFVNVAGRLAGIQGLVSILAGGMMILMGLSLAGLLPKSGWLDGSALGRLGFYQRWVQALLRRTDARSTYPLGLVLGLLPCGLLYTAEIAAAGTGSPVKGALAMLSFGLGTVPALFAVGLLSSSIGVRLRGGLLRLASVMMIGTGGLFVWRSLTYGVG